MFFKRHPGWVGRNNQKNSEDHFITRSFNDKAQGLKGSMSVSITKSHWAVLEWREMLGNIRRVFSLLPGRLPGGS